MAEAADGIIIAGAGQAAAQLAQSLRAGGYAGPVTMVGDEAFPPYERPPLSKDYLSGKRQVERLFLRPPAFWAEKQVELRLGRRVAGVDRLARRVVLDDSTALPYAKLVWAAGGRPRRLSCPGTDLAGIHHIRSIADIDGLKAGLVLPERRVVIVGGGYIGLESAAVLRSGGHHVTVLETQDRLLARVTASPVPQFLLNLHRGHGVDVRLSTGVEGLTGGDGQVAGVRLSTGELLPADLVVVGIGIIPNVEPLAAAGLACPDGVQVDEYCRTSDPDILAIGDCALHPSRFAPVPVRLESVQNAIDQAKCAAGTILGQAEPYTAMPWFWSDQYAVKMQTAGLSIGHDTQIVRGAVGVPPFSVVYLRDGRVIALDCLSCPRDFMQGRALVTGAVAVNPIRLADPTVELKALVPA
ncbi:NAD(P)/FAD-dependent oxidoreductase [Niveispirillum sp. KHB5.9]|uniref:NAD(P)/FAD-dependent oxidoreductase n=1 Tax=Niveispirillum sp. KHB5.9 TaxID=3400269 RepID=UPI003A89E95F